MQLFHCAPAVEYIKELYDIETIMHACMQTKLTFFYFYYEKNAVELSLVIFFFTIK